MFINRLKVDKSADKVADLVILNKIKKPSEESFYNKVDTHIINKHMSFTS